MMIVNDTHLGVNRQGGTTPASRELLREYCFTQFSKLIDSAYADLCILGDLFDSFEVAPRDWLETYLLLTSWCETNQGHHLYLVAGNHDVSMKGTKVSSFETLTTVLSQQYENVVVVGIDGCVQRDGVHIIAHHRNQETFELTLGKVLGDVKRGDHVLVHANYDNKFAEAADHSLNISQGQALEFTKKGVTLVFAHEHQSRMELPHATPVNGGAVVVLGNQFPTSVADCLGNRSKHYWTLGETLEKHECWVEAGSFSEVDWRQLGEACQEAQFIRVVGDAVNAEASQVIDAIHKFRQKSSAFVVSTAVKIDGIAELDDLPEQFEAAKKFDVMDFVYKQLDDAETAVIRKLVEEME